MTTGRRLAPARESALAPDGLLPPLVREMRGSLNLVRLRPGEGLLLRPAGDLDELLLADDFASVRELLLEALLEEAFNAGLDRRVDLLFVLAVDFVGWRAMI